MNTTSVFAEITKTAPQDDGSLMVYGKATGSDLDLDGQRCDPIWLQQAMPEFMKIGNVREQHDAHRAVGKAIEHDVKDDGHYIRAHIVDPVAVAKTRAGIFTGFSIGIKSPIIDKSDTAPNGMITAGKICEISIVDRPALPTSTLVVCKAAKPGMKNLRASEFDSNRMLVKCEELTEDLTAEKSDEPELTITLGERLSPEAAEKLKRIADGEKAVEPEIQKDDVAVAPIAQSSGLQVGEAWAKSIETGVELEFDRDFAKSLVVKTVAGADSGLGQDESGDISGALQAITIIAELIQSEAKALGTTPAQGCDIDLLMQAVHALRIFNCREAKEQAGIDPGPGPIMLAADADITKDSKDPYGDVSYADPGYQGDKKKRYPLDSKEHAKAAWSYINKSENADKYSADQLKSIKSRIKSACKKFGVEVDADSQKAADVDNINTVDEAQKAADAALVVAESAPEEVVKTVDASEDVAPDELAKTETPEATKAAVEPDGDALVKALSAALEKADNPLRKSFEAIIEASTETVVKSVTELTERLVKVESMAVPGGPALRRTEVEHSNARKNDLMVEAARFKSLAAANSDDPNLRKGYDALASQLDAQIKAL